MDYLVRYYQWDDVRCRPHADCLCEEVVRVSSLADLPADGRLVALAPDAQLPAKAYRIVGRRFVPLDGNEAGARGMFRVDVYLQELPEASNEPLDAAHEGARARPGGDGLAGEQRPPGGG